MIDDILASIDGVLGVAAAPTGDPTQESSGGPHRGPDTQAAPRKYGWGGYRPGSGSKKRIFEEAAYIGVHTTPETRDAINELRERTGMPGRAFCELALRLVAAAYPPGTRYTGSAAPRRGPDTQAVPPPAGDPTQPVKRGRGRPRKYPPRVAEPKRIPREYVYVWFRSTPAVRDAINELRERTGMPGYAFCELAIQLVAAVYPPGTRYESSNAPHRGPDTQAAAAPTGDPTQPVKRGRGRPRKYPKE